MDNKQNYHSNMVLPPLGGETKIASDVSAENLVNHQEIGNNNVVHVEKDNNSTPIDISSIKFSPQNVTSTTNSVVDNVSHIDDNDTTSIPKEWIVKTKHIISSTSNDPREQNIQINKLRAEYMKKRFGIDLKLTDD